METAFYVSVLLLVVLLGLQVAGSRRYRGRVLSLAARLHDTPPTRDAEGSLPPIVADFARRAGADPLRPARVATFHQTGELRLKPGGTFRRFDAWQVIALGRAGFLWDARQTSGPPLRWRVLDAYVGSEGILEARILGSLPVARAAGSDVTLGEAYRYLAELPWSPDAILGNPGLEWRLHGPDRAEVRMRTAEGTARVTFRFDSSGDIVEVEATGRPTRDSAGNSASYDWRGRFADYAWIGDRRVPETGEVGYVYPSGYEVYFRGRISEYRVTA